MKFGMFGKYLQVLGLHVKFCPLQCV